MVEHRTENSGVGGSIPFIGSISYFILFYFLKKVSPLTTFNDKIMTLITWYKNLTLQFGELCVVNYTPLIIPYSYTKFFTKKLNLHLPNIFNRKKIQPW